MSTITVANNQPLEVMNRPEENRGKREQSKTPLPQDDPIEREHDQEMKGPGDATLEGTSVGITGYSNTSISSSNTNEGINVKQPNDKVKTENTSTAQAASAKDKPFSIKKTSNTTLSRFKEKRPEPLRLNPSNNQDTPLDLSFRSAGNAPSATSGNIFNSTSNMHMTTLETPRIQWQDNELLIGSDKNHPFSASNSANHKSRMASLTGESPPMTPGSPLFDLLMANSAKIGSAVQKTILPLSASLVLDSTNNLSNDTLTESKKSQILERWFHSGRIQLNHSKNDLRDVPRRSCSTDSLNRLANEQQKPNVDRVIRLKIQTDDSSLSSKKASISPLATKSLSSTQDGSISSTKFSYSNQQIAESEKYPDMDASGKSLTPTSLANATANLLNIQLNSPTTITSVPSQDPTNLDRRILYKNSSLTSNDQDQNPTDPPVSTSFCQQRQSQGSSSVGFQTPSTVADHIINNVNYQQNMMPQHHSISSISSSATLNTPTLISPNQGRGGHLCFLSSPTLSPMSSVFDLPSPLLMYQAGSSNHQNMSIGNSKQNSPLLLSTNMDVSNDGEIKGFGKNECSPVKSQVIISNASDASKNCAVDVSSDTMKNSGTETTQVGGSYSADNLTKLITSATTKIRNGNSDLQSGQGCDNDDEINMDIELDLERFSRRARNRDDQDIRSATVIPQICVSDHQDNGHQKRNNLINDGEMRELIDNSDLGSDHSVICESETMRSSTPRSFLVRAKNYQNERSESSSAPPEIDKPRVRSKIKTFSPESCFDLACRMEQTGNNLSKDAMGHCRSDCRNGCDISHSQYNISQNHRANKPYPERRELNASVSHNLLHTHTHSEVKNVTLGTRSNSAEPAFTVKTNMDRVNYNFTKVKTEASTDCFHPEMHLLQEGPLSQSAQQLNRPSTDLDFKSESVDVIHMPMSARHNPLAQHQNRSSYHCYQQQHSISASELHNVHTPPGHTSRTQITAMNNIGTQAERYHSSQRQSIIQTGISTQDHSQHATSSLSRVDCLSSNYQQIMADQRLHYDNNITDSASLARHTNNQTSVMNLLCNSESCQQTIQNINLLQRQNSNPLTSLQYPIDPPVSSKLVEGLHYSYQVDIESRSDSRSSSSMEFSSAYVGSGSRPSSAASSNLAPKKYHCDLCPKSFTRSDMLTRHKRLHSGDKPFQCGECKQEFSRSDHLSTHMRTHTGEKPYKCKMCTYSACRKDMITRHLKVHSRNPNASDFV